jgi:YD repeat-containing protein
MRSCDCLAWCVAACAAQGDDEVGNVAAITDGATDRDQRGNRTMTYDGLDRLTDVVHI